MQECRSKFSLNLQYLILENFFLKAIVVHYNTRYEM